MAMRRAACALTRTAQASSCRALRRRSSPLLRVSAARLVSSDAGGHDAAWLERGREWAKQDPNPRTRDDILALVHDGDAAALQARLGSRLAFGTAGIRGPMAAGASAMNDLTVIQTCQGLVMYLEKVFGSEEVKRRGVAIGYDHRASSDGALFSEQFALLSAAVLAHRGVPTYLYSRLVATPLVPWCVQQKGCVAGVMVTASHNPKEDNGYKVYWENGAQIISPHDTAIAASIEQNLTPWAEYDTATVRHHLLVTDETDELADAYLATMARTLCRNKLTHNKHAPPVVYTAMHGVGAEWTRRAFEGFGLQPYVAVLEQLEADPSFPTVEYPNPEEGEGALALSFARAESVGASLVLANDPDADRLAAAELLTPQEAEVAGVAAGWRVFSGNEIGLLLGHWQWTKFREAHSAEEVPGSQVFMLASAVSSKSLSAVARHEGFCFEETLTGFKWMGNRSQQLREAGKHVIFSFEEAIGFCVGDLVKDKDGVTAAAVFAEMAAELRAVHGRSCSAHLQHLAEKYGHFVSDNGYLAAPCTKSSGRLFEALRAARVGGSGYGVGDRLGHGGPGQSSWHIKAVRDLQCGFDSSCEGNVAVLPPENMITYTLDNDAVVTLRTSGTEPKLKYYVELPGPPGCERRIVAQQAADIVRVLRDDLLGPALDGAPPPQF